MTRSVQTLPLDLTLVDAVGKFLSGPIAFPIAEAGILKGYCRRRAFRRAGPWPAVSDAMRDFMRKAPRTVRERCHVCSKFGVSSRRLDIMPVVAADGSGRLVGTFSPLDADHKAESRGRICSFGRLAAEELEFRRLLFGAVPLLGNRTKAASGKCQTGSGR